jgi:hypothetical protein
MTQSKKQLTAEEIIRAKEKNQKKKDKRKEAVLQTQEEPWAKSKITSTGDRTRGVMTLEENTRGSWVRTVPDEILNCCGPNGEWVTIEEPPHWNKEELNVGWPWERVPPQLLTQAPYAVNEHNFDAGFFQLPQEVQVSNFNSL